MTEVPGQRDGGRDDDDVWRMPPPSPQEPRPFPPTAPPPPQWASSYVGTVFAPVRGLGIGVSIMIGLVLVVQIGEISSLFGRINLVNRVLDNPGAVSMAQATQSDETVRNWVVASGVAYLAAAILFAIWFFRIRKNAGRWEPQTQRRSQGWSFWGWVCPIVNFWFPFQIASDALESSRTISNPVRSGRLLLGFWWATWLSQFVFGAVTRSMGSGDQTASKVVAIAKVEIVGDVVYLISGVLAIFVVRTLTELQQLKMNDPNAAAVF